MPLAIGIATCGDIDLRVFRRVHIVDRVTGGLEA